MKRVLGLIIVFISIIMLNSCSNNMYVFGKFSYYNYFDTNLEIIIEYNLNKEDYNVVNKKISASVEDILESLEKEFAASYSLTGIDGSTAQKVSLSSIDNPVLVSDDFLKVLNKGLELSKICNKFDLTIGKASLLWKEASDSLPIINSDIIDSINYENIIISDHLVYLENPGSVLDFGAIAKGYAVDLIKEYLETLNYTFFLINFGGNIYISDTSNLVNNQDIDEAILLDDPKCPGEGLCYILTNNKHIVTTNTINRYLEIDGVKYGHIIDARTGYPVVTDILSVTIIGDSSLDCDGISTICYLMGYNEAKAYLENNHIQAIIITNDYEFHNIGDVKHNFINETK